MSDIAKTSCQVVIDAASQFFEQGIPFPSWLDDSPKESSQDPTVAQNVAKKSLADFQKGWFLYKKKFLEKRTKVKVYEIPTEGPDRPRHLETEEPLREWHPMDKTKFVYEEVVWDPKEELAITLTQLEHWGGEEVESSSDAAVLLEDPLGDFGSTASEEQSPAPLEPEEGSASVATNTLSQVAERKNAPDKRVTHSRVPLGWTVAATGCALLILVGVGLKLKLLKRPD